jgi:hypothetical protein
MKIIDIVKKLHISDSCRNCLKWYISTDILIIKEQM